MERLKTCPASVPPPPVPPSRTLTTAAASSEPSRQPLAITTSNDLFRDVLVEMKRIAWPVKSPVCAMSCVTIGLLSGFTLFVACLDFVAGTAFQAPGLSPK